ncbi:MAG TPA: 1,4-dihydroxy-2-naphthoate polyprenyltransferase [Acidimicrobiales bacterium]
MSEPGPIKRWVLGARPRTLPAAVVPVLVGTAAAACGFAGQAGFLHRASTSSPLHPGLLWWRAAGALVVALAIQIGTNYANDYSDGIRGTDDARVGPVRLVATGLASPGKVKRAALAAFAVAGVVGLGLAAVTSWWVLAVGAACLAAGWLYTGGPRPYGYAGYGEAFVFVFFGVVATAGSAFVQTAHLALLPLVVSVPVGLLATALLLANNLRDIASDRLSGKRTLAVRIGRQWGGRLYVGCLVLAYAGAVVAAAWRPWSLLALATLPLAYRPMQLVLNGTEGRALLPVLADTGRLQLAFGFLLAVGLWI